jgi:hypothetical protein
VWFLAGRPSLAHPSDVVFFAGDEEEVVTLKGRS